MANNKTTPDATPLLVSISLALTDGGGPCFFMDGRGGPMRDMDMNSKAKRDFVALGAPYATRKPKAILVISGHFEERVVTVQTSAAPPMLYDYGGFPASTYELQYSAPGAPAVAARAVELLRGAGVTVESDAKRGYDHGTFIPLLLMFPACDVPTFEVSLHASLDPALHLRIGQALSPLCDEGVLIVGSGSSMHNFDYMLGRSRDTQGNGNTFQDWLEDTLTKHSDAERATRLLAIESAPAFRVAHPREEHFTPLLVAVGAATPTFPVPATKWSNATPVGAAATATDSSAIAAIDASGAVIAVNDGDEQSGRSMAPGTMIWQVKLGGKLRMESYRFGAQV